MKSVQLFTAICCLSVLAFSGCSSYDKTDCGQYTTQATCSANSALKSACYWTGTVCSAVTNCNQVQADQTLCQAATVNGTSCKFTAATAASCAPATGKTAACTVTGNFC